MIIELSEIPPEGRNYRGEEPVEALELTDEGGPRVAGPLEYHFRADLVVDELIVRGRLGVRVDFVCSRCAERFESLVVEPHFNCALDIRARAEAGGSADERRQRVGAGEKPTRVDLTGDIREAILLAFPSHPVCSADCKGLCAQCGTNLNLGSCDCRPPEDRRWQALEGLAVRKGTSDGRTKKEEVKEQGP